jgi:hypothetical protein
MLILTHSIFALYYWLNYSNRINYLTITIPDDIN